MVAPGPIHEPPTKSNPLAVPIVAVVAPDVRKNGLASNPETVVAWTVAVEEPSTIMPQPRTPIKEVMRPSDLTLFSNTPPAIEAVNVIPVSGVVMFWK